MQLPKYPLKILDKNGNAQFATVNFFGNGEQYTGGGNSRRSMQGWNASGGDADSASSYELGKLRTRCRDLDRNSPLGTALISRPTTHSIGTGLILQSQIDRDLLGIPDNDADEWGKDTERRFHAWASNQNCDIEEQDNFYDMQSLAFISSQMSGDCFTLLPIKKNKRLYGDLRIRILEADYCGNTCGSMDTKSMVKGVELGKDGNAVAYNFANRHPEGSTPPTDWKKIKKYGSKSGRRQVIHLFKRRRPGQHRGVPALHAVVESLKQLTRFTESELMATVVSSFFTVFVKQTTPQANSILEDVMSETEKVAPGDSSSYEMGNGNIIGLGKDEDISFADPKRPNNNFGPFYNSYVEFISAAIGVPMEVITLHFTSSYSAARAALLEAWNTFKGHRTFLSRYWCQPIYEEWLTLEIANGRIKAPGFFDDELVRTAYCISSWIGQGMGMIDPQKETTAALERIDGNLSNHEREHANLLGGDWRGDMNTLSRETTFLESKGLSPADKSIDNDVIPTKTEDLEEE